MIKTLAAKNKGICFVALLSLTLLLGFISAPPLNYNQERQPAPKELVSRPSSPRRVVIYRFLKKHFPFLFFLSSQEIVSRLTFYEGKVKTELFENLKPVAFADRLKKELLSLALGSSKLTDSYVLRG